MWLCGSRLQKDLIQVQRTFGRRTGELNGSLSGSARFISLLTIMEDARFSLRIGILTVQCAPREMGFLCFNIELVVVYQTKLFDPEQLTTSNFGRRLVPVCDLLFVY